jgi:hypothetical protein
MDDGGDGSAVAIVVGEGDDGGDAFGTALITSDNRTKELTGIAFLSDTNCFCIIITSTPQLPSPQFLLFLPFINFFLFV